jgi:hypothetical protein
LPGFDIEEIAEEKLAENMRVLIQLPK